MRTSWLRALAAGVVATAALVGVRTLLWRLEDERLREAEMRVREGAEATGLQVPVRQAAHALGVDLTKAREEGLGLALAWALGVGGVVLYAVLRERFPGLSAGRGLAFGLAVFLLEDEGLLPLLGWARPPQAYPWTAHARGLAAHTAYGVAAEAALP